MLVVLPGKFSITRVDISSWDGTKTHVTEYPESVQKTLDEIDQIIGHIHERTFGEKP